MTTASEPSADSGPSAVTYSERHDTDNRWGPMVVVAIIAAIAIVAAGITAGVVLANKTNVPEPPHPLMPNMTKPVAAAPMQAGRSGGMGVELMSTQVPLANGTVMAAGDSVDLGDGIKFDAVDGWKVAKSSKGFALLVNDSYGASFAVSTGTAKGKDTSSPINAADVLTAEIQMITKDGSVVIEKMTKIQGGQLNPQQQVNFDQLAYMNWAGSVATQSGTTPKFGEMDVLFNSGSNKKVTTPEGFFVFATLDAADQEKYATAGPDVQKMFAQLVGVPPTS
ncbi:MAG: hypothetical protein QOH60_2611 [Mycobacterium sp.]|jgi:hypothetical protein|nr:hypothetical protein [Mycobacterium sp.]